MNKIYLYLSLLFISQCYANGFAYNSKRIQSGLLSANQIINVEAEKRNLTGEIILKRISFRALNLDESVQGYIHVDENKIKTTYIVNDNTFYGLKGCLENGTEELTSTVNPITSMIREIIEFHKFQYDEFYLWSISASVKTANGEKLSIKTTFNPNGQIQDFRSINQSNSRIMTSADYYAEYNVHNIKRSNSHSFDWPQINIPVHVLSGGIVKTEGLTISSHEELKAFFESLSHHANSQDASLSFDLIPDEAVSTSELFNLLELIPNSETIELNILYPLSIMSPEVRCNQAAISTFTNTSSIIENRNECFDLQLDKESALKIAQIIFIKNYGKTNFQNDYKDLIAIEKKETWIIRGVLKQKKGKIVVGGVPEIEIRKKDGKILHLTHYK